MFGESENREQGRIEGFDGVGTRGPGLTSAEGRVLLRAIVGSAPGQSFMLKVKDAVVVRRIKKGMARFVELEVPAFDRAILRFAGKQMRRCFVLEPAAQGNRYDFPPFFIEGNCRVVEKINNPRRASEAFRAFVVE